jgi:hypothetical protein
MQAAEKTMPDKQTPQSKQRVYPGEKARQGYIALNTPARRIIFISGLIALVILALVGRLWLGS